MLTTCFQRDSAKDQAVVFVFIGATVGLLGWAALRPWVEGWREVRACERDRVDGRLTEGSVHGNDEVISQWLVKETSERCAWFVRLRSIQLRYGLNVQYRHEAEMPKTIVDSFMTLKNSIMQTSNVTAMYKLRSYMVHRSVWLRAPPDSSPILSYIYSFLDPPFIHPNHPLPVSSTLCTAFSAALSRGPPTTGVDDVEAVNVDVVSCALASCTAAAMPRFVFPCASWRLISSTASLLCSAIACSSFQSPCSHHSSFEGAFRSAFFLSNASCSSAIPVTSADCAGVAVPDATAERASSRILAWACSSWAK